MPQFKLHHVGCAVPSIEVGLRPYVQAMEFSRVSKIVEIRAQKVRVCFVETAPGVFVELVHGLADDSPVASFLNRRQYYYHLCYSTRDVRLTIAHLEANGFRRLSLFESEAFGGTECGFLLTPEMALVELCTDGAFSLL